MQRGFMPAVQMTICAVSAYFFAHMVLGHSGPLFAATSSLIALGFGVDSHISRVIEVSAGCTLGILIGELLHTVAGTGLWVAALVLMISILLARFLDPSSILTTQMGLQSLLVILLPAPDGGPFTRSLDAVVGGTFALIIVALWPQDPRKQSHSEVRDALNEFAGVLRECAGALAYADSRMAWHALIRARGMQPTLDKLNKAVAQAREISRISPLYLRHRTEIQELRESLNYLDLAIRNARIFARRLSSAITHASMPPETEGELSHIIELTAESVEALALGLGEASAGVRNRQMRRARLGLNDVASRLSPEQLGIRSLEGETLVLILRPMIVDLLEASGLSHDEAREHLPDLPPAP
ncbi:FUSC family protein [Falsarthrobacter nasiphocae]